MEWREDVGSYIWSHKIFITLSRVGSGTLPNSHDVGRITWPTASSEGLPVNWSMPPVFLFISPKALSSCHAVLAQKSYWISLGNGQASPLFPVL